MATWYAQKGSCNIDSVSGGTTSDVWNAAAGGGGAWMDTSVLTAGGNTVLAANAQTAIAVNISIDLGTGRLSTAAEGGTAGGGFTVASAVTITANIVAGTTTCLTASGAGYTLAIIGDCTGGTKVGKYCLLITSALKAVNITGDVTGGSTTDAQCLRNESTASINISGDVTGGSGAAAFGLDNRSTGAVAITGNLSYGAGTNAHGVRNLGAGVVTVTAGNLLSSASGVAFSGGCLIYHPGATNYIQIAKTTGGAGTYKYGKTIPAADVRSGVDGDGANAPATGTLVAGAGGMGGHGMTGGIPG